MNLYKVVFSTTFPRGNTKDSVTFLVIAPAEYIAVNVADNKIEGFGMIPETVVPVVTRLGGGDVMTITAGTACVIDTNVRSY